MCMHCSQMCDNCKPADMRAFQCEACGKTSILSREDCLLALGYWKLPSLPDGSPDPSSAQRYACRTCGADLSGTIRFAILPRECLYAGILCGYPCGRHTRKRTETGAPCRKQILARTDTP